MNFMIRMASLVCLLASSLLFAQNQPAKEPPPQPPQAQAPARPMTSWARLHAARTVYFLPVKGTHIPYDVVSAAMESWGRFVIVNLPEKADLLIQVFYEEPSDEAGAATTSAFDPDWRTTNVHRSSDLNAARSESLESPKGRSSRAGDKGSVRMIVRWPGVMMPIWVGRQFPKMGIKQKTREDHLVEASEQLFREFHDCLESPEQPTEEQK